MGSGAAAAASYGFALYVNDDIDDLTLRWGRYFSVPAVHGSSEKPKLVVLGSGWGAMSLIRKLDLDIVDLTVVSPRPYFFYTPLLAGSATGTVSHSNIAEPVRHAVFRDGVEKGRYIQASCQDVDFKNKKVRCAVEGTHVDVPYDKLVVAVGAQPATFGIKGVQENAYFLKELEDGVAVRSKVLSLIEKASALHNLKGAEKDAGTQTEIDRLLHFVVVGGGPTGTELCGELSDLLKKDVAKGFPEVAERVKITLVEGLPRILSMFDEGLANYAQKHLGQRDIDIRTNKFVAEVSTTQATLKDAKSKDLETIDYGMLVWAAGITTRPLVRSLMDAIGKDRGQDSRRGLKVDEFLQVQGADDVYAIGDCAVSGLPPTAQVASQQGKYLGRILREEFSNIVKGEEAATVVPQFEYKDKGKMAYIGGGEGVVEMTMSSEKKSSPSGELDYSFWRALHGAVGEPRIAGQSGFMIWRSVYFSMLLSAKNRVAIAGDWARTFLFGRDITTPPQQE